MELLLFLIPSFIHGVLMGDLKQMLWSEKIAKKPLKDGISAYEDEDIPAAFRFFDKFIARTQTSALAYLYRAKCHLYFDNHAAALPDLSKSLRLDNTIRETYLLKAECHYYLDDFEEAMREYRRASQFYLDRNAYIKRRIGELELRRGNYKKANDFFNEAARLGDEEAENLLHRLHDFYRIP